MPEKNAAPPEDDLLVLADKCTSDSGEKQNVKKKILFDGVSTRLEIESIILLSEDESNLLLANDILEVVTKFGIVYKKIRQEIHSVFKVHKNTVTKTESFNGFPHLKRKKGAIILCTDDGLPLIIREESRTTVEDDGSATYLKEWLETLEKGRVIGVFTKQAVDLQFYLDEFLFACTVAVSTDVNRQIRRDIEIEYKGRRPDSEKPTMTQVKELFDEIVKKADNPDQIKGYATSATKTEWLLKNARKESDLQYRKASC